MPAGFDYPARGTEIWTPMALTAEQLAFRSAYVLNVVARLRAGASLAQARDEMAAIALRLNADSPVRTVERGRGAAARGGGRRSTDRGTAPVRDRRVRAADRLGQPGEPGARPRGRAPARRRGAHRARRRARPRVPPARHRALVLSARERRSEWSRRCRCSNRCAAGAARSHLRDPHLDRGLFVFAAVLCVATTVLLGAVPSRLAWRLGLAGTMRQMDPRAGGSAAADVRAPG